MSPAGRRELLTLSIAAVPPGADCPVTERRELVSVVNDGGDELRMVFETNDGTWEAIQPRLQTTMETADTR